MDSEKGLIFACPRETKTKTVQLKSRKVTVISNQEMQDNKTGQTKWIFESKHTKLSFQEVEKCDACAKLMRQAVSLCLICA